MGIPDNTHHPFTRLALIQAWGKSIFQSFDRSLSFEGWQPRAKHQLDGANQLISVWSEGKESFDSEVLE